MSEKLEKVRLGVIGFGNMGTAHCGNVASGKVPKMELTAICDIAPARIDRYGSDYGSFTSLEGTPYEMRAVAPGTDQRPYSVFEVVEPINVKSGSIASWFDEPGGGIQ